LSQLTIFSVGTRHVKVWRVDDGPTVVPSKQKYGADGAPQQVTTQPTLKTLSGRNCILGPLLLEASFSCVGTLSEKRAIVCTDKGDICLLDDNDSQRLSKVAHAGFGVSCLALDVENGAIIVGGRGERTRTMRLAELLNPSTPPDSPEPDLDFHTSNGSEETGYLCAMATMPSEVVVVDAKHSIVMGLVGSEAIEYAKAASPFAAHTEPVLGVKVLPQPNCFEAAFFTWSGKGTVLFWDLEGCNQASLQVPLDQMITADEEWLNQCQNVQVSADARYFVSGDKYGVMRIIDGTTSKCKYSTKAHGSTIHDIAICDTADCAMIATCGRDRTVQLFREVEGSWQHIQTLDEHATSVSNVLFCDKGEKLISCAADRTIHIREIMTRDVDGRSTTAAISVRSIVLKQSPVSMAVANNFQTSLLVVSSLDRTVATYDLDGGRLISSFRATDNDNTEAVVMDSLVLSRPTPSRTKSVFLAGISGTDKSVRVYDASTGAFLDREWGHTEAVTGIALLEDAGSSSTTLISTATDGTIMIWAFSPGVPDLYDSIEMAGADGSTKEVTARCSPLRRVLPKGEIAEFQRSRDSRDSSPAIGRASPPRTVRKKGSKYGLSQSLKVGHKRSGSDEANMRKMGRNRSRSPSGSPIRRGSVDVRSRATRTNSFDDGRGLMNDCDAAAEQMMKSLRAFRKRIAGSHISPQIIAMLREELEDTAKSLPVEASNAVHKATHTGESENLGRSTSSVTSEASIANLLDDYSEKLIAMIGEKLGSRLVVGRDGTTGPIGDEERYEINRLESSYNDLRAGSGSPEIRIEEADA
jgi:WD40 repeat protein